MRSRSVRTSQRPEPLAEHVDGAARRVLVQRGDPQQRGLARAVGAEHDPALAGVRPPSSTSSRMRVPSMSSVMCEQCSAELTSADVVLARGCASSSSALRRWFGDTIGCTGGMGWTGGGSGASPTDREVLDHDERAVEARGADADELALRQQHVGAVIGRVHEARRARFRRLRPCPAARRGSRRAPRTGRRPRRRSLRGSGAGTRRSRAASRPSVVTAGEQRIPREWREVAGGAFDVHALRSWSSIADRLGGVRRRCGRWPGRRGAGPARRGAVDRAAAARRRAPRCDHVAAVR